MSDVPVSIGELQQDLDTLIERAAHGNERVVLHKDGKPTVVIIGIEALHRLEAQTQPPFPSPRYIQALTQADALRQRIER